MPSWELVLSYVVSLVLGMLVLKLLMDVAFALYPFYSFVFHCLLCVTYNA